MKIKAVILQARGNYKPGDEIEVEPAEFGVLYRDGIAVTASEAATRKATADQAKAVRATNKERYQREVKASVAAAKKRGAIPAADEQVEATALARIDKLDTADASHQETVFDVVKASIDGLKSDEQLGHEASYRTPTANRGADGFRVNEIQFQGVSLAEATKEYVRCTAPMDQLIKTGKSKEAIELSRERAVVVRDHLMKPLRAGDDFLLRDAVKAADYTDPNSQVGTLATGLILMRNLGYLVNKLPWLKHFTTDLRNEPAKFGQPLLTRYITPPDVLTFIPGIGFTSDAATIAAAGAGTVQTGIATQTSGTLTKSAPSSTDVAVTIDQFKGTEIEFPITTLGSTVRNLFAEQRGAQIYSLAENINVSVLAKIFAATWSGTVTKLSLGATFGLPSMVKLKNRMTLSKIPDIGRYALLHSTYHDNLLVDGNLLTAKAILALTNKDASAFEQGEVPELFGVKPLESQLATYKDGTYTAPTITAANGDVDFATPGVNQVGFAGNMSSMVFAARVPQDFTQAAKDLGIPSTNAIEIITEPDSGLTLMVFKYVDNGKMSISHRVCLMWGSAQGDPRIGIVLTP
jgi:hypothetical protein